MKQNLCCLSSKIDRNFEKGYFIGDDKGDDDDADDDDDDDGDDDDDDDRDDCDYDGERFVVTNCSSTR